MIAEDEIFEYLTFGATFGRAFRLFIDQFDVFMGISIVFFIPYLIFTITLVFGTVEYIVEATTDGAEYAASHLPKIFIFSALDFIVYELACVIGQGAISIAVAEIYVGRRPRWMSCLKRAWSMKYSLVCSSLLVFGSIFVIFFIPVIAIALYFWLEDPSPGAILIIGLLMVAIGVFAIYWGTSMVLSSPAIAVENIRGPVQGLKRSWELSKGSMCYLWSVLFCLSLGAQMLQQLLTGLFNMATDGSITGQILAIFPTLLFLPLSAILESVLYLNLRVGRESINQQVLMDDLMKGEPASSRFRNDDPAVGGYSGESIDYRHVPLVDEDETELPETHANGFSTSMA